MTTNQADHALKSLEAIADEIEGVWDYDTAQRMREQIGIARAELLALIQQLESRDADAG